MTILIVDDKEEVRRVLTSQLHKRHYAVFGAQNSDIALHTLEHETIDLVLLDYLLPGQDGLEAFTLMKQRITTLPPVIMMTAHATFQFAVDFLNEGGSDFIETPCDLDILDVKIRRAIARDKELQHETAARRKAEAQLQDSHAQLEHEIEKRTAHLQREIAERNRAEEALRQSEEQFREFVETAPDAIVIVNEQGRIELVNGQTERMFGYSRDELQSQRIEMLLPERFREIHVTHRTKFLKEFRLRPMGTSLDLYGRRKDGQEFPVDVMLSPLRTESGVFVLSAVRDITERKHTERELRIYREHLEQLVEERTAELEKEIAERQRTSEALKRAKLEADQANQAKSQFLASMSHELRTPLNGILGYTQLLKRDASLTQKQMSAIQTIHQSGNYLLTLISDVLDLAKIEAGKIELEHASFSLTATLQAIVNMIHIRTSQKGVEFVYDAAPNLPVGVYGDEKRLRQMVLNLLGNAVKFTKAGSVRLRVVVLNEVETAEAQRTYTIRFEVEDSGIGISEEHLKEIFHPFQQVGEQQFRSQGTGLGLAISQQIAVLMGSEIHVQSIAGQGSRFWFELDLPGSNEHLAASQTPGRQITGFTGAQPTILLVDDQQENLKLLEDMLNSLGFAVQGAVNGQEALAKIEEFHPDLVLMDLLMPVMDGYEAMRRIRQTPETQDLSVICISASAFEETRQKSREAGFDDFVAKPVTLERLVEILDTYLAIEWMYKPDEPPPQAETASQPFVLPPKGELEMLFEAAKIGNILEIHSQLDWLKELDPAFAPFTQKMKALAQNFEMNQMYDLLVTYMTENE